MFPSDTRNLLFSNYPVVFLQFRSYLKEGFGKGTLRQPDPVKPAPAVIGSTVRSDVQALLDDFESTKSEIETLERDLNDKREDLKTIAEDIKNHPDFSI